MNKTIKKFVLILCFFILAFSMFDKEAFAAEEKDISEIATKQSERNNPGQVYLNEPLDNAIPIIYKYEIDGDGRIVPGEEFKLKFTVYNPAVVSKVGNVRITAYNGDNLIYPGHGHTNSVYLGYLDPLSYTDGELNLIASKDITDKEVVINLMLSYTDNYSTDNSQQLIAVLPVLESGKLTVEKIDMPSSMHVGTNNRLSLTYRNNGLSTINDVTLHVKGDNLTEKVQSLGSVGSGTSITSDAYLEFVNAGEQAINVYFTYTDNDGKKYETEQNEFDVNVLNYDETPVENTSIQDENKKTINHFVTYGILLISCIALWILFIKHGGFSYIKKKVK